MKISTKDIILVSMFTALTIVGAFMKIPMKPAPVTLQFLFTALAGIMLGSKLGALSQLVYVVLGLVGIPVFTEGGGISYIFKPSFGYLIGFIVAAYIIGKIVEASPKPSISKLFIASAVGIVVIYIIGVPYLYIVLKYVNNVPISIYKALKIGLLIFLPGDFIKCLVTTLLGAKLVPILKRHM